MTAARFTRSFTQQVPIPEEGIAAAVAVLQSGRLHRYNIADGEVPQAAALEREFADWQGSRYCLAVASGGQAMQIALRAAGVRAGDKVLTNAFTLAPVPGAIAAVGGEPVLVEITEDLVIDLDDLAAKASASGAGHLLLSNMRGHLCDMDRLMEIASGAGLTVIEDCAHTMGARWARRKSGSFGLAGCFSTQTYKHMNSGEGGLLTSDDSAFMARAMMTGCCACAMALFISTASQPSSIACAASDAVPTPASTSTGTLACSMIARIMKGFTTPRPEPIGAPSGMTAAAPASSSRLASGRSGRTYVSVN